MYGIVWYGLVWYGQKPEQIYGSACEHTEKHPTRNFRIHLV